MEYLVLISDIWMDEQKNVDRIALLRLKVAGEKKYQYRIRKYDIIEQRPDGFWIGANKRGFRKDKFIVVAVKGYISNIKYDEPLYDTVVSSVPIAIRAHAYGLNLDGLDISNSIVILDKGDFENRLVKNG